MVHNLVWIPPDPSFEQVMLDRSTSKGITVKIGHVSLNELAHLCSCMLEMQDFWTRRGDPDRPRYVKWPAFGITTVPSLRIVIMFLKRTKMNLLVHLRLISRDNEVLRSVRKDRFL
jgi:hypothetical protein